MANKLLVLSMDAMVTEDLEYLRTKPNFSKLFSHAARVGKVRTVYPSVTYPAHTAMITGCRPGKNGIIDNNKFTIQENHDADWFIDAGFIRTDDIFRAAKRVGLKTASVYWPVTGNHPAVDCLLAEFVDHWMPDETPETIFPKLGSSPAMMEIVAKNRYRYPIQDRDVSGVQKWNTADHFLMGCACDVIRREQPDLLLIHNCYPDSTRHRYGVFHEKMKVCLDYTDLWLGDLIDALEATGTFAQTNFVLVSDHGQMDYSRRIRLNTKFVRDGMITLTPEGDVADWRLFEKSAAMSAFIFVKDPSDRDAMYAYLQGLLAEGVWGFERIRTVEEARADYGLDGDFAFVLETDGYTAFADDWHEPICNPIDYSDYRLGRATHGYEPEKGPQPVFLAAGPDFRPDAFLPTAEIYDEGPTYARILGTELRDAEGRALTELIR